MNRPRSLIAIAAAAASLAGCELIVGTEDSQTRQLYRQTCPGASHPLLQCSAPLVLTRSISLSFPNVVTHNGNFLASFVNNTDIEMHEISASGGRVSDSPAAATHVTTDNVRLSGSGGFWALTWRDTNSHELGCTTSTMAGQSSYFDLTDAGYSTDVYRMGVATNEQGGVSIALAPGASEPLVFSGASSQSCPNFYQPVTVTNADTFGITPVAVPGAAPGAWPVVASTVGTQNTLLELLTPTGGGTFNDNVVATNNAAQGDVAAVLSSDGRTVISAYGADIASGVSQLQLLGISADGHSSSSQPLVMATFGPSGSFNAYWTITGCGAGCTATSYVAGAASSNITVGFVGDQLALNPLGPMLFDVACNQTLPVVPGVAGGYAGGKLGVLFTGTNEADFYICDLPLF